MKKTVEPAFGLDVGLLCGVVGGVLKRLDGNL